MRSRSNSLEDTGKSKSGHQVDGNRRSVERGEPSGRAERCTRHREPLDNTGTIQRNQKTAKKGAPAGVTSNGGSGSTSIPKAGRREKSRDLSRDDLVFLLSLLEGELQVSPRLDRYDFDWIWQDEHVHVESDQGSLHSPTNRQGTR